MDSSEEADGDDILPLCATSAADFHTILVVGWSGFNLLLGTPDGLLVYSTDEACFPVSPEAAAERGSSSHTNNNNNNNKGDSEEDDDGFVFVGETRDRRHCQRPSGELKQLYRRYIPGGVRLLSFYRQSSLLLLAGFRGAARQGREAPAAGDEEGDASISFKRRVALVDISIPYKNNNKKSHNHSEEDGEENEKDGLPGALYAYDQYNAMRPAVLAETVFPYEVGALTFTPRFIIVLTTDTTDILLTFPHGQRREREKERAGGDDRDEDADDASGGGGDKRKNLFVYNQNLEPLLELTASLPREDWYCKDVLVSSPYASSPSQSLLAAGADADARGYPHPCEQYRAVFPGAHVGEICIFTTAVAPSMQEKDKTDGVNGLLLTNTHIAKAHQSPLRAISVSADGSAVATMGDTGTTIQVYVLTTSLVLSARTASTETNTTQQQQQKQQSGASPLLLKVEVCTMPLRRGCTQAVIHSVALNIIPLAVYKPAYNSATTTARTIAEQKRQLVFSSSSSGDASSTSSSCAFEYVSTKQQEAASAKRELQPADRGDEAHVSSHNPLWHLVSCLTSTGTIHFYVCDVVHKRPIAEQSDKTSIGAVPSDFSVAFATRLQPSFVRARKQNEEQSKNKNKKVHEDEKQGEEEQEQEEKQMRQLSCSGTVFSWQSAFSFFILHFGRSSPPRSLQGLGPDHSKSNSHNNSFTKRPFILQLDGYINGIGEEKASLVFTKKGERQSRRRKIFLESMSSIW